MMVKKILRKIFNFSSIQSLIRLLRGAVLRDVVLRLFFSTNGRFSVFRLSVVLSFVLSSFVLIQSVRYDIFGVLIGFEGVGDGNRPAVLTDSQYEHLAREFEGDIYSKRVELLNDELARVRDYEKQLSDKASELNSVLSVVKKQNVRNLSSDGKSVPTENKDLKSRDLRRSIGLIRNSGDLSKLDAKTSDSGDNNYSYNIDDSSKDSNVKDLGETGSVLNADKLGVGGGIDWTKDLLEKLFSGELTIDSAVEDGLVDVKLDSSLDKGRFEDSSVFGSISDRPLSKELEQIISRLKSTPIGAPLYGSVSSGFGMRRSPFSYRGWQMHSGLDIRAARRAPTKVTADGVVKQASWDGAFGKMVIVDHGNGYETCYAHLSSMLVSKGDRISRGTVVGLLGNTGRTTGAHVHYEIRYKGNPVNPSRYIKLAKELSSVD